jgi:hypothetical protein
MDQAPSIDEFEGRKRLIQAKMELHRAEMAVYLHEFTRPFATVSFGVSRAFSNPVVRWLAVGALGYYLVVRRRRRAAEGENWLASIIMPRLRQVLVGIAVKAAFSYVKSSFRLR